MSRIKVDAIETTSGRQVYPVQAYLKLETSGGALQNLIGGNVTSGTDLGVGHFRANFTSPLVISGYTLAGTCSNDTGTTNAVVITTDTLLTTSATFWTTSAGSRAVGWDAPRSSIQITL